MIPAIFIEEAENDLRESYEWYQAKDADLALQFEKRFRIESACPGWIAQLADYLLQQSPLLASLPALLLVRKWRRLDGFEPSHDTRCHTAVLKTVPHTSEVQPPR